ncbi:MAG: DUF2442 domain-containing protein [Rikenellaceae bacterium]
MEVKKVRIEDDKIFILTEDGKELWQSISWYPRLMSATEEERTEFRITAFGIRWDNIDEDVSFESFTYEEREPTNEVAQVFSRLKEIKVSKLAERVGISQSLLASYICGAKRASTERKKEIEEALHELGKELLNIRIS